MKIKAFFAATALSLLMAGTANAACSFQNTVPLKSLSAGFQAWKSVTSAMAECGNFQAELDQTSTRSTSRPSPRTRRSTRSAASPPRASCRS